MRRNVSGFTLIELLVVIAVIGVLAAGVFTAINPLKRLQQARDSQRKIYLAQIQNALTEYYVQHQKYPATVQDVDLYDVSNKNGFIQELIDQGYLKTSIDDPLHTSSSISCIPGHKNWTDCKVFAYTSIPDWYGVTSDSYAIIAELENTDDPMLQTHSCQTYYRGDLTRPCIVLKP